MTEIKKESKVSIITPVYNGESYIEKFLISIERQTYDNYEWIIVDDGSKDRTAELIREYIKINKLENIVLISIENSGVSNARNRGLQEATGEFIMFADSDDVPHKGFISEYVNTLKKSNSDMAIFSLNIVDEHNNLIKEQRYSERELSNQSAMIELLNQNSYGYLFSTIAKKSLWQNKLLRTDIYFLEDEEILLRLFMECEKVLFSSSIQYDYVQRQSSVVHNLNVEDYHNAYMSTMVMRSEVVHSKYSDLTGYANARVLGALMPLTVLNLRTRDLEVAKEYISKYRQLYPDTTLIGIRGIRRRLVKIMLDLRLYKIIVFMYRNVDF